MYNKSVYALAGCIIFSIFLSMDKVFCQDKNYLIQEYSYLDDTLEVTLNTNKLYIPPKESMRLKFKLKNISRKNILIFKEPNINFVSSIDYPKNKIIINYGDEYTMDLIVCDTMLILKPMQKVEFNYEFYADSLLLRGIKSYVNIFIGLGFISNLDKIYEYDALNKICLPNIINNKLLELSTNTIQAALSRKVLSGFFVRINEK